MAKANPPANSFENISITFEGVDRRAIEALAKAVEANAKAISDIAKLGENRAPQTGIKIDGGYNV